MNLITAVYVSNSKALGVFDWEERSSKEASTKVIEV
jgi:hypothetical protein